MLRRPGHGPSTSRIMTYRPPAITDQPHPAQRKAAAAHAGARRAAARAHQPAAMNVRGNAIAGFPGDDITPDEADPPPGRTFYNGLPEMGRPRATVCHAAGEWARDVDGDGIREVHVNTLEGLWTGLRNFLRMFRGVNKKYLYQYVAIFEWGFNIKRVTPEFIRAMLGVPITTFSPP